MRPKMFKRRKNEREKKLIENTIINTDELIKRQEDVMRRINELFDDVDIKDKHIFKEEHNKHGNNGRND